MSVHRTSLLAGRQVDDSRPLSVSFPLVIWLFLCSWQEIIKNKLYGPGRRPDNQRKAFRLTNYTRTDNDFVL